MLYLAIAIQAEVSAKTAKLSASAKVPPHPNFAVSQGTMFLIQKKIAIPDQSSQLWYLNLLGSWIFQGKMSWNRTVKFVCLGNFYPAFLPQAGLQVTDKTALTIKTT